MRYQYVPIILFLAILAITVYSLYPSLISILHPDMLAVLPKEARRQRFSLILDARTPKEREHYGFYPNSILIDPSRIAEEVPFLLGQKPISLSRSTSIPSPILVYSQPGDGRASRIAQQLHTLGFTGVRHLKGSYQDMLPPGPL